MYEIGALVMYGRTGVCRVADISRQEGQDYYTLKPLFQSCDIYTPVESEKVFIRPIISREEADRLIDELPDLDAEVYDSHVTRELSEHYQAAIASHSCRDLFSLTKSLYAKKQLAQQQKKRFGAVDERFMKWGQDLLFGELAAVLGITPEEVPQYIADRLSAKV